LAHKDLEHLSVHKVILNSRYDHYILAANLMMILTCFLMFFFQNNFLSLIRICLMLQRSLWNWIISVLICFLTIELSFHVARNQTLHIMFIFSLLITSWLG
jgi:hypothetical protein